MEAGARGPDDRPARFALSGAILLCLALQLWLALRMEINWDEFFYLAQLYDLGRGDLRIAFQTFHVHLLGWLKAVPGQEPDQVVAGRIVMLALQGVTCCAIFTAARTWFSVRASLFATLTFASAGFTIIHGASFRADPLAAALLITALALVASRRWSLASGAAVALCGALALLVTVKSIFYAPALLAVAGWRWTEAEDRRRAFGWLLLTAAAAAALFATGYLLHASLLPQASAAGSASDMGGAARTTLLEAGLFPRAAEMMRFAVLSPVQCLVLLVGAGSAIAALRASGQTRREAAVILACAAPLLSLAVYRNAYPYFFPFILAPAALLAAFAADRVTLLRRRVAVVALLMAAGAIAVVAAWSQRTQTAQRAVIGAVHDIFPAPVAAIDRNSMIASFPKRGFFMSTWGLRNYRRRGPEMAAILSAGPVPLVIANGPALEHALGLNPSVPEPYRLLPEDHAILRANFIPHWGPLWVAGQVVPMNGEERTIRIAVPGPYTLEGASTRIDGKAFQSGEVVTLTRGEHRIGGNQTVTLRWGKRIARPAGAPPSEPIYRGF